MSEETTIQPNSPEQLMDILFVLDKEKKKIQAVKSVDEHGNMETVDPKKSNMGDFMKIDRHGNFFSNLWKNFVSELKKPTNFTFFKVPSPISMDVAKELQKQVKNPTPEGEQLMQQYEVKQEVAKEQDKNVAETPNPQQEAKKDEYKYKVEDIDWDTMNNLGLSKEYLEKRKILDTLLKGFKSKELVPISLNLDGAIFRSDARIWLQPGNEGKIVTAIQGVKIEPELKYPFFGHKFTDEDKKNLLETGNMGRVVDLTKPKSGEVIPSIISIDRLTNDIVAYRTEKMKIPDTYKGVTLDESQKQALSEGKAIYLKDMTTLSNKTFSSYVQFNADKKYVEPLRERKNPIALNENGMPTEFRKQKLSDEQLSKLVANQSAYISLVDKEGKPYSGYITYNKETHKFDFTWPKNSITKGKSEGTNNKQGSANADGTIQEGNKNNQQQDQNNKPADNKQSEIPASTKKSKGPKI